ncbi:hypothetical protein MCCC1A01412_28260 [Bacillus anthracis]|uniref:hypothetical protein n=1 Tax=Bacillus anthracis TaxID=1392 RepID=UPI0008FE6738|nr:hypothetical protein [Bacillus anthracis]AXO96262.1 hypothetical protein DY471_28350 [Bacillus anthracis]OJD97288.1 hypothetical protein MCCC1A01412_28260 [Bacillus anthracis]
MNNSKWIDQYGTTIEETEIFEKIYVPEFADTVYLRTRARYEWNPCSQENWARAWVTNSEGLPVKVPLLTVRMYGWIDEGNRTIEKSVKDFWFVEMHHKEPCGGPLPCMCVRPDQVCSQGIIVWNRNRRTETRWACAG